MTATSPGAAGPLWLSLAVCAVQPLYSQFDTTDQPVLASLVSRFHSCGVGFGMQVPSVILRFSLATFGKESRHPESQRLIRSTFESAMWERSKTWHRAEAVICKHMENTADKRLQIVHVLIHAWRDMNVRRVPVLDFLFSQVTVTE